MVGTTINPPEPVGRRVCIHSKTRGSPHKQTVTGAVGTRAETHFADSNRRRLSYAENAVTNAPVKHDRHGDRVFALVSPSVADRVV